ncbi:hypothetical protein BCR44DRAFT_38317, partial [Catenaria anguillulae PL171]
MNTVQTSSAQQTTGAADTAPAAAHQPAAAQQPTVQQLTDQVMANLDTLLLMAFPTDERIAQGGFTEKPRNVSMHGSYVEPMPVQRRAPVGDLTPALPPIDRTAVEKNARELEQQMAVNSSNERAVKAHKRFVKESNRIARHLVASEGYRETEALDQATHMRRTKAEEHGPIDYIIRLQKVLRAYFAPKLAEIRSLENNKKVKWADKKDRIAKMREKVKTEEEEIRRLYWSKVKAGGMGVDREEILRSLFVEHVPHMFR